MKSQNNLISSTSIHDAYIHALRALHSLKVMVDKPHDPDRSNIDATIQRFEFTIELFWKLLKKILEHKGIPNVVYPKDVLQKSYAGGLINHEEIWLKMLHDRNLTSHTYNEALADRIYSNIKKIYYPVFEQTIAHLDIIVKEIQ